MDDLFRERVKPIGNLPVIQKRDARADRDGAAHRMNGKLHFLAFFQAKCLYNLHRQGYRERTSGLDERAFHGSVPIVSVLNTYF